MLPPCSPSLPSLAAGDDASRKDHYWNSCHPHPLPLSPPLSRNWGSRRLARKSNEDCSSRERERERQIWIRAGGAEKEGAIRLKSSTALMDSNANIVAVVVVASEAGKIRMGRVRTIPARAGRRETLSRRPFYRPCPDGGVIFGHRRQGRDKRE